jgi:ribose/xylose/arabinose/galactoside ABC-type transport system permease subunit
VVVTDERVAYRGLVQRLLLRPEIGALIGTAAIWIFFWSVGDVFGTAGGAANYLDVASTLGIMAVAVSMLMIGGEFDLSSGSMQGATAMLVILLVKEVGEFGGAGLPLWLAIPMSLAFAIGIGWFNGTMVEKTGLPSFIVTLGAFFVLRGGKLGFAKLFTDKVIVEGLDRARGGYEFFNVIFGSVWTRNNHVFNGRDTLYAILLVAGASAMVVGLMELAFRRRERPQISGLLVGLLGVVTGVLSLVRLTGTDTVSANWIYSIGLGLSVLVAMFGLARWRFEPAGHSDGLVLDSSVVRRAGIGLGAIILAVAAGMTLDPTSIKVVGFLLTVQGLRAVLLVGGAVVGVAMLMLAGRRARSASRTSQFLLMTLTSAVLVGMAFFIQSESSARKFRAELFAVLLLTALLVFGGALLRLLFEPRIRSDPATERLGRLLSIGGVVAVVVGILVRLLFMTTEEVEATRAIINYRISILWFIAFAIFATWLLTRTRFGSWTFAVGGNKLAARSVGVPAARTKTTLFMMVSGAAWLVGMLLAFRLNSVQANVGDGEEFEFIIAAVVGGNLLTGGYGSAAGAAIGALIMAMSFQGIPFSGWNSDWRFLFLGVILLLAVLANNYVRRKAEAAR